MVGHGEPGGIFAGRVGPVGGGELVDGFALECAVDAQILLGDKGIYVGLNGKHFRYPSSLQDPASCRSIPLSEAPDELEREIARRIESRR
jgi:hypothetical protein